MKNLNLLVFFISLLTVLSAESADPANIVKAMGSLCAMLQGALAVGMLLLIIVAAIVYAVGQMLGAETRARASVWATAMFMGSLIGAVIYIIVPWILAIMMKGQADSSWVQNCCTSDPGTDCFGVGATE